MWPNQVSDVKRGLSLSNKKALRGYFKRLNTTKDTNLFDDRAVRYLKGFLTPKWRKILDKERKFWRSIQFTQSRYDVNQILVQIRRYTEDHTVDHSYIPDFKAAKLAMLETAEQANLRSLKFHSDDDVIAAVNDRTTSAGWLGLIHSNKHKSDFKDGIFSIYKQREIEARRVHSFCSPIMIGYRTQASLPYDDHWNRDAKHFVPKTRLVHMVSYDVILAELQFSKPVQAWLSNSVSYAGGKNDDALRDLLMKLNKIRSYHTSIDMSHFDQSIPGWLIHHVFDIIRVMYKDDPDFDEELFKIVRYDFIHKVILSPTGVWESARDGVPSGSMFTQIVDSLCNELMLRTYLNHVGMDGVHMITMGDDNILFSFEELDLDDMSGYLHTVFGMDMHPDKCSKGNSQEPIEFLSRIWKPDGVYRNPLKIMIKIAYPERYRNYKDKSHPFSVEDLFLAYSLSFPLGISECCEMYLVNALKSRRLRNKRKIDLNSASGSMKYRLMYADSFDPVAFQRKVDKLR